jgi:DnaJ-domain-containing protein 1
VSDDAPPPLPASADAFELLGVAEDADERAIKRAYARLIKLYRPDRRPAEFARIQAAFDEAKAIVARTSTSTSVRDGASAYASTSTSTSTSTSEDEGATASASSDATASTTPIALDDPELTWRRVRDLAQRHRVHDLLLARLQYLLLHERPAALLAFVEDADYLADAEADPVLALLGVEALTAIAWRHQRVAAAVERYQRLPRHPALDGALARADLEVTAAARLHGLGVPPLPPALLRLFALRGWASPSAREALYDELALALDAAPLGTLSALDRLIATAPAAARALADVAAVELPPIRRTEDIPAPVWFALVGRLAPRADPSTLAAYFGGPLLLALARIAYDDPGVAALLLVVPATLAFCVWLLVRGIGYRWRARRPVARLLVELGVPMSFVLAWLRLGSRSRFARFRRRLERDRGLELLGLIATVVREQRAPWQEALEQARRAAALEAREATADEDPREPAIDPDDGPLPAGDDPFVVLGVPGDAGASAVEARRAKLLALHRGDRDGDALARIDEAYARLRFLTLASPAERAAEAPAHTPTTTTTTTTTTATTAELLAAAGDPPRLADLVARLLEARTPLDVLGRVPAPVRRAVVASSAITWSRLRSYSAAEGRDVLLAAHLAQLAAGDRGAGVVAFVDDDGLRADAAADPALASIAVRALAAVAWCDHRGEDALARYRALPASDRSRRALVDAGLELTAAGAVMKAHGASLPPAIGALLARRQRTDESGRAALIRAVVRLFDEQPRQALRALDRFATVAPAATAAVIAVTERELPGRTLAALPASVRAELDRRVGAERRPDEHRSRNLPIAFAIIVLGLLALVGPWSVTAAMVVGVPLAWAMTRGLVYRLGARREIAAIIIDTAVPRSAIDAWLASDRPSRYRPARRRIARDRGLALLAAVATLTRSQRLCWQDGSVDHADRAEEGAA